MNIIISGATGFIGSHLVSRLLEKHNVSIVTTDKNKAKTIFDQRVSFYDWSALNMLNPDTFDVVINLSGENIAQKKWSQKRKLEIIQSRLDATQRWINWLSKSKNKFPHLYNASAIGVYGAHNALPSSQHIFTEHDDLSIQPANDYLSIVASEWEKAAHVGVSRGIPITLLRFAVVLKQDGGMLKKLLPAFKFGLGAILGDGQQKISWIKMEDVVEIILFLLNQPDVVGPINLVAPEVVTQRQFAATLAKVLHRPLWLKLPAWVIKKLFGQMGSELLLSGQAVYSERLKDLGFEFQFPRLEQALYVEFKKN